MEENIKLNLESLNRLSPAAFEAIEKNPFVLILDDVRSFNNVGSAFRTSDAFNVKKIYLCGITGRPPHRDIEKTALGATETVAWEYHENAFDLVTHLKTEDYEVVAVEQTTNSVSLADFKVKKGQKYAFIFGNEVFGVNEELVKNAHFCLEIPQFGTKHSLNISVTVGIISWEFMRQIL